MILFLLIVPERVVCSGVSHVSISDHYLVYAFRKLSIDQPSRGHTTVNYRKFKNFNSLSFHNDISQQRWDNIYHYDNPNDMWEAWKGLFLECVDKHAPLRTKRVRSRKSPWITPRLKKRLHERDVLKLKATRSKVPNDWRNFKNIRNMVNNEVRTAKESYYKDALNTIKGNSQNTWRIINELLSKKSKNCSVKEIVHNGTSIYNSNDLSDAFNNHFSSVGPRLANEIPDNEDCPSHLDYLSDSDGRFELNTSSSSNVRTLLSKLCKSKATGLDRISARLLRECSDLIANHLCSIFNQSIVTGVFPGGIPQGTILGPLLFIIYINDLPNCLEHSQPRMFADDTHLSFANNIENIDLKLNEDLARVNQWLTANKLTLNTSKTEFMLIGSRQRLRTLQGSPSLMIGEEPIKQVNYTKSLGVFIDHNLSWNINRDSLP